jgi:hypothetical protein
MGTKTRLVVIAVLFAVKLALGIWLARSGRPYNVVLVARCGAAAPGAGLWPLDVGRARFDVDRVPRLQVVGFVELDPDLSRPGKVDEGLSDR